MEDDVLSISFEEFERILIFNREPHQFPGEYRQNFEKRIFLQFFQLLMTISVHLDVEAAGNFGMI